MKATKAKPESPALKAGLRQAADGVLITCLEEQVRWCGAEVAAAQSRLEEAERLLRAARHRALREDGDGR